MHFEAAEAAKHKSQLASHDVVSIDDAAEAGETQMHIEAAQDGQPHSIVTAEVGETQVHMEAAQDGQPHSIVDPGIEVANASHQMPSANVLDGQPYVVVTWKDIEYHTFDSADDDDDDDEEDSSHGSHSDKEFMGPHAEWKMIFWK